MTGSDSSPAIAASAVGDCSTYSEFKRWRKTDFGKCSNVDAAFFSAEIAPLGVPERGRVLELGFGNGSFLAWCRHCQFDYSGIEIDPVMRDRAAQLGAVVYESITDTAIQRHWGTFDMVAAFDVIEHIESRELELTFLQIARLLRKGGYFVAQFPNGDSPFGRVNQHGDLTHVTTLGRGKIRHLASLTGLTVVSVGDPKRPWKHVGLVTGAKRLFAGMIKGVVESVIRWLYFGGDAIGFDQNAVAIMRK